MLSYGHDVIFPMSFEQRVERGGGKKLFPSFFVWKNDTRKKENPLQMLNYLIKKSRNKSKKSITLIDKNRTENQSKIR